MTAVLSERLNPEPLLAGRAATRATVLQTSGWSPSLLPRAVRQDARWEFLRREIVTTALSLEGELTFDFRRLLTKAAHASIAGKLLWAALRTYDPEVLIGPGFGAAPLLFGIANAALEDGVSLQVLMVRDKRKDYHQRRWIEGDHDAARGKRAVLIDDFMKAGSAVGLVRQALDAEQLPVQILAAAVFFDMWEPLGSRQLTMSGFPVVSLFTRHDIGLTRDCFDARPPLMTGQAQPPLSPEAPLWRCPAVTGSRSSPAIAAGAVFALDGQSRLWRFNALSGEIDWIVEGLEQPQKSPVQLTQVVAGDVVYSSYDGTVTRVDGKTGQIRWRWKLDSSVHATPWVDPQRDRLFVSTEQWNRGTPLGHLQCIEWSTGKLVWKDRLHWWPPASPVYDQEKDIVVAACNDRTLAAWTGRGERLWTATTRGLVRGRPLISHSRVYTACEAGVLTCHDLQSGELIWSRGCGRGNWHQFPQIAGDDVLVVDGTWHLLAFNAKDGRLSWISRLRGSACWTATACGNNHVGVLSSGGQLALFDVAQHLKVWEAQLPGTFQQPPAVGDGLFATCGSNGLSVYRLASMYV